MIREVRDPVMRRLSRIPSLPVGSEQEAFRAGAREPVHDMRLVRRIGAESGSEDRCEDCEDENETGTCRRRSGLDGAEAVAERPAAGRGGPAPALVGPDGGAGQRFRRTPAHDASPRRMRGVRRVVITSAKRLTRMNTTLASKTIPAMTGKSRDATALKI